MKACTGWITAATALARQEKTTPAHYPSTGSPFSRNKFLADVERVYRKLGYALITCCEGLKDENGDYLTASQRTLDTDRFGRKSSWRGWGDALQQSRKV